MTEMSERHTRRKVSGALAGGAAMSLGLTSPKGLAQSNFESMPAFTISAQKGIPDKASIRTQNTS